MDDILGEETSKVVKEAPVHFLIVERFIIMPN